jgi:murein DD-endopeptidase MepM/ murein hydrolase activator NlpD
VRRFRCRLGGALAGALLAGALVSCAAADAAAPGYLLPWAGGQSFRVLQGPFVADAVGGCTSGCGSHEDEDGHYAWDFDLPEGTAVLAARAGTVRLVVDSWSADHCGGTSPIQSAPAGYLVNENMGNQANLVLIEHGDGTSALYLHLSAVDPAIQDKVRTGAAVAVGERLGWSGRTGMTGCVPHLHFQVEESVRADWYTESRPIAFSDPDVLAQDPDGVPAEGGTYTSGNVAPTDS